MKYEFGLFNLKIEFGFGFGFGFGFFLKTRSAKTVIDENLIFSAKSFVYYGKSMV